jgi:hypothetical protein
VGSAPSGCCRSLCVGILTTQLHLGPGSHGTWEHYVSNHVAVYSAVNGFSRKIENHTAAVALNDFVCNFIRIHRTLRTSPAMAVRW